MDSRELRIGNLIYVSNPNDELIEIMGKTVESLNIHHLKDILYNNEDWVYEPIPLTYGWLVKFGFKFSSISLSYELGEFNVCSNFENDEKFFLEIDMIYEEIKIKYVHQLQNLYFALTQKELIIC